MKKLLVSSVLCALLSVFAVPVNQAQAQMANIAQLTCGEYLAFSETNQVAFSAWAAGLLTAELGQSQPTFDLDAFAPKAQELVDACTGNEDTPVGGPAMEVLMYLGE